MILRTVFIAACVYVTFYPKKSTWGILSVYFTDFKLKFDFERFCISFDIYIQSTVRIWNPNLVDSWLDRSKFDLFQVNSKYSIRKLGFTEVKSIHIPGRRHKNIEALTIIENMDIITGIGILLNILKNDYSMNIMALGSAQVKPSNFHKFPFNYNLEFLVGIKCIEKVQFFTDNTFVKLANNVSRNCLYTYQFLPKSVKIASELPRIDRKYIYI